MGACLLFIAVGAQLAGNGVKDRPVIWELSADWHAWANSNVMHYGSMRYWR